MVDIVNRPILPGDDVNRPAAPTYPDFNARRGLDPPTVTEPEKYFLDSQEWWDEGDYLENRSNDYYNIIGLPPQAYTGPSYIEGILSATPVLFIRPAMPKGVAASDGGNGIKLYTLDYDEGNAQYIKILKNCGVNSDFSIPLRVAFVNEGPVTESWSNEYTESMFEQVGNLQVPFMKELSLMYGTREGSALQNAINSWKGSIGDNNIGNVAEWIMNKSGEAVGGIEKFISSMGDKGTAIKNLIYGSDMDFPLLWGGSTYATSHSINVRLTNPFNTDDDEHQAKYIIDPLARLLALGVPVSDSPSTYSQPLIMTVNCPGLFEMESAYVQSIDVTKGFDGNEISFQQRPSTVEVRITFGELYSSMIATPENTVSDKTRPTIAKYINNLRTTKLNANGRYIVNVPKVETKNVQTHTDQRETFQGAVGVPEEATRISTRVPSTEISTDFASLTAKQNNPTIDETVTSRLNSQLGNPTKDGSFISWTAMGRLNNNP